MFKNKKDILTAGLLFVIVAVTAVVGFTHNSSSADCMSSHVVTHTVTIKNDTASPATVQGNMCDTLIFKNLDNVTREVAFGPHENHVPYDGVAEKFLNKGQSFSITLNKTGTYHWHDHLHDEVTGYFVVSK